ncbi:helix-turn-helix domain-containing protein [Scytonema sp. UIC 10036]|uniref:helix-turn-helix domain-containing protein n=1 Tax=Scytonema sp. UIC 10036 TaxID=2304196 RepID=UPI0012DAF42B|nr:helix-turn-helix transcriptional regulator [Scytonema sp. UIC 10036]MUH01524.1 helix-turn-helix domain-containing protein [Scytonema sp. UIC 10036]
MIKNEYEYQVTKSWVGKFQQAIITFSQNEEKKQKDPEGWQLMIDSYFAQIKNLLDEIADYESLLDHNPEETLVLQTSNISFSEMGKLLVKARIAQKISLKELAALTRLTEEKLKEYENKDYQNASFNDVIEVAEALGIKLQHCTLVSKIDGFLSSELTKIRQHQHINIDSVATS